MCDRKLFLLRLLFVFAPALLYVHISQAQITFTEHTIAGCNGAICVYAIDMDNDGDMDVLGSASWDDDVIWWENDGFQWFTQHVINGNIHSRFVHATDMDGDGDVDVLGSSNIGITLWRSSNWWDNDVFQQFTEFSIYPSSFRNVYGVDLDIDGDMDIVSAYWGVFWLENDGNQQFTPHAIGGNITRAVCVIDLDGDTDLDIVSGSSYDSTIVWWENNGNQVFVFHYIDNDYHGIVSVCAADMDNDGDVDIISGSDVNDYLSYLTWWENNGNQQFTEHTLCNNYLWVTSVYVADINSDGYMDILNSVSGGAIYWWENNEYQQFTPHLVANNFYRAEHVYAEDVDGDGDMDVLGAASYSSNVVKWWENSLIQQFDDPSRYDDLMSASVVDEYSLGTSYPNPFNPTANIPFHMPAMSRVSLKVYNTLGREVAVAIDGQLMTAGSHEVAFDGSALASGIYFYQLSAGEFSDVGKMVLMK